MIALRCRAGLTVTAGLDRRGAEHSPGACALDPRQWPSASVTTAS